MTNLENIEKEVVRAYSAYFRVFACYFIGLYFAIFLFPINKFFISVLVVGTIFMFISAWCVYPLSINANQNLFVRNFREISVIGFKDWYWFVIKLKRNEFSRKLNSNYRWYNLKSRNGNIFNAKLLIFNRRRAHNIDLVLSKLNWSSELEKYLCK